MRRVNLAVLRVVDDPRNAEDLAQPAAVIAPSRADEPGRRKQKGKDRAAWRTLSAEAGWHTIPFVAGAKMAAATHDQTAADRFPDEPP